MCTNTIMVSQSTAADDEDGPILSMLAGLHGIATQLFQQTGKSQQQQQQQQQPQNCWLECADRLRAILFKMKTTNSSSTSTSSTSMLVTRALERLETTIRIQLGKEGTVDQVDLGRTL
mmetsp:Transcript_21006/g.35822  ORF Transcript_21006/g.35822 Transcript_21006/m.35822 type:complete len:118 (-) Transcript_21006:38-391(-)